MHLCNVLSASSIGRVPSTRNWLFYLRCWPGNCSPAEFANQLIPCLFSHFSALLQLYNFCHWLMKFWEQLRYQHCIFFLQTNSIGSSASECLCSAHSRWKLSDSTGVHRFTLIGQGKLKHNPRLDISFSPSLPRFYYSRFCAFLYNIRFCSFWFGTSLKRFLLQYSSILWQWWAISVFVCVSIGNSKIRKFTFSHFRVVSLSASTQFELSYYDTSLQRPQLEFHRDMIFRLSELTKEIIELC